jgi:hypothetical protein
MQFRRLTGDLASNEDFDGITGKEKVSLFIFSEKLSQIDQ